MYRRLIGLSLTTLLALGGCASLSESQCLASDWQTIGYRDGLGGVQSSALMKHQNACMKHGVVPDRESYLAGWREGVEQYCQPHNGFSAGESGNGYSNVCPSHLQDAFHTAYRDGRQLYLARSEIASLHHEIDAREYRLREVKAEMAAIAGGMLDSESTTADRATLLLTAKDLAFEQGKLQSELEELRTEAAIKAERLEHLQHTLAFAQ